MPDDETNSEKNVALANTTCSIEKCFLMVVNDTAHVQHAAVAYFHVVLVKDKVEIVVWWEVLLD